MMLQAMKFKKKPVVIDAMQYTGDVCSAHTIMEWTKDSRTPAHLRTILTHEDSSQDVPDLCIVTLSGGLIVSPGDWVIRGMQGEHYPCKPDIFAATYEQVDAE